MVTLSPILSVSCELQKYMLLMTSSEVAVAVQSKITAFNATPLTIDHCHYDNGYTEEEKIISNQLYYEL